MKGEVLKVWYSPYYAKRMNKNVIKQVNNEECNSLKNIGIIFITNAGLNY